MIIGALLPLVGNLLHLVGAVPVPGLDLGPFAFAVSCFVMAVGLFRYRLLDLAPVARRAILESMREGIIVVDDRERVVEINPAARQMLALSDTDVIGRDNVLRDWTGQCAAAADGPSRNGQYRAAGGIVAVSRQYQSLDHRLGVSAV
jgi:PAS domain-containing protein